MTFTPMKYVKYNHWPRYFPVGGDVYFEDRRITPIPFTLFREMSFEKTLTPNHLAYLATINRRKQPLIRPTEFYESKKIMVDDPVVLRKNRRHLVKIVRDYFKDLDPPILGIGFTFHMYADTDMWPMSEYHDQLRKFFHWRKDIKGGYAMKELQLQGSDVINSGIRGFAAAAVS